MEKLDYVDAIVVPFGLEVDAVVKTSANVKFDNDGLSLLLAWKRNWVDLNSVLV